MKLFTIYKDLENIEKKQDKIQKKMDNLNSKYNKKYSKYLDALSLVKSNFKEIMRSNKIASLPAYLQHRGNHFYFEIYVDGSNEKRNKVFGNFSKDEIVFSIKMIGNEEILHYPENKDDPRIYKEIVDCYDLVLEFRDKTFYSTTQV
jgi:hypothetical protein